MQACMRGRKGEGDIVCIAYVNGISFLFCFLHESLKVIAVYSFKSLRG